MNYTFSFVIPHHNSPELLNRCLDSIPAREDIQIIVVDDNSQEDRRPQIARPDVEVYYIDVAHTKGAGHARNVGLSHAKGKWLLFPDCDDYYMHDFIGTLDKYIDSEYDIIYFNFEYRDGTSGELLPPLPFYLDFLNFDGTKESCDAIKFHHNTPWTKMISRGLIQRCNALFEEVPNGNDILFSMKVGYAAKRIAVEKSPLYVYLKNKNSIGNKYPTALDQICRIEHIIKQNFFYSFIGHPEWKKGNIRCFLSCLKILTVNEMCHYLRVSLKLFKTDGKAWVRSIVDVS